MITFILLILIIGGILSVALSLTGMVLKLVYFLVIGLPLAIILFVAGIVLCCTLIGIPLGKLCFKLAAGLIMPF